MSSYSHLLNNQSHSVPYYKSYISCDFCGQGTRGQVFLNTDHEPYGGVFCSSCHGKLLDEHDPNEIWDPKK